jgi:hypothetical protein
VLLSEPEPTLPHLTVLLRSRRISEAQARVQAKRNSIKLDGDENYSAVAMAAMFSGEAHKEAESAMSEVSENETSGGGKGRRKSAPQSLDGNGERRRSFVDAEREKHAQDLKKVVVERERKERVSMERQKQT